MSAITSPAYTRSLVLIWRKSRGRRHRRSPVRPGGNRGHGRWLITPGLRYQMAAAMAALRCRVTRKQRADGVCSAFSRRNSGVRCPPWNVNPSPAGWMKTAIEELILLALKESVFAGKVHFRYIDRILLEWARNRVKNAQDVKAYSQKFRGGGR